MRHRHLLIPMLVISSGFMLSCGRVRKTQAEIEREEWLLSLNDSISAYKTRIDNAGKELDAVRGEIGEMVVDFNHVSNPKLVEGYYIYKGWDNRFPPTQTGIAARITQNEGFELIAASTSTTFNQISVTAGNETLKSSVVPHDQALNYRAGNLNRVCFYGAAADSIGELIAANTPESITLTFINGENKGSFTIPKEQKEMITATWQLFSSQREAHKLENEIPMLSRRIDACRRMLEANDSILNK